MRGEHRFRLVLLTAMIGLSTAAWAAKAQQPAETAIPPKVYLFIPYKEYTAEENQKLLEMYKWLRVADVSDGMDVAGLKDIGLVDPEIHALWKDTQNFTHRIHGIAVTARYVPTNRRERCRACRIGRGGELDDPCRTPVAGFKTVAICQ